MGIFLIENAMRESDENMCPFCTNRKEELEARVLLRDRASLCIYDKYPVSNGHALVISDRHVSSFFELDIGEQQSMLETLSRAKALIDRERNPQGYNIGINDGAVAGQTIFHVHIHLIPRYDGDVDMPEGGVRWIFPDKANYRAHRD